MLLVNSTTENCGVYQYGKRLWKSISGHSDGYKYVEVSTAVEFLEFCTKPKVILFNYIACGRTTGPLGWLTNEILADLKASGHIVGTIGHLTDVRLEFDFIVSQDPSCEETGRRFALPRPLLYPHANDLLNPFAHENSDAPVTLGSFGFASPSKGFQQIVKMVCHQYGEATIRLNITNANYHDADGRARDQIVHECLAIYRPPGVKLVITNKLLSDDDVIAFLRANDLNIFAYEDCSENDGGIASVIDYAITAGKPIAISSSFMFRHIYADEICIEKRRLSSIISLGSSRLEKYRQEWSMSKISAKFREIMTVVSAIR
jgi:hypothetical protein